MSPCGRKPDWLKVRFAAGPNYARIEGYHRRQGLHSVCRSAACPNQGECWSRGTATFMILGDVCTRGCAFCNVGRGAPLPPDPAAPQQVAQAIAELGLRHAVITSVTRDDLPDGGASQFAALVQALRRSAPECRVELLIPDLGGDREALDLILAAAPQVIAHNIETVPRLYPQVRRGANYRRSLRLLAACAERHPEIPRKSGLMLGMGEEPTEILRVLRDLHQSRVNLITLGQYLAPSRRHHPVARYLPPEEFAELRNRVLDIGFDQVLAGPLVRSSYHAEELYEEARPAAAAACRQ